MRRDVVAMLFWALRWHEGRRVSYRNLADVLWGDFGSKPQDAAGSIRELMGWVEKRYGDKWSFEDCKGKAFRILPRRDSPKVVAKFRRRIASPLPQARGRPASVLPANRGDIGEYGAAPNAIEAARLDTGAAAGSLG
jgi:hypothetical protein